MSSGVGPWWSGEMVALDLEMTGLDVREDRICEIGVVSGSGGKITDRWSTLVDPGRPCSAGAAEVLGLSDAELGRAPAFEALATEVRARLDGKVCIAHHVAMDRGFLEAAFEAAGERPPEVRWIDTLLLARNLLAVRSHRLGALVRSLGVPDGTRHRALGDAEAAWGVLHRLMALVDPRGRWTVAEICQLPDRAEAARRALVDVLRCAMRDRRAVRVVYLSRDAEGRWRRTEREVEVKKIRGARVHVYCHLRGADRVFRIERMHLIEAVP